MFVYPTDKMVTKLLVMDQQIKLELECQLHQLANNLTLKMIMKTNETHILDFKVLMF